MTQSQRFTNVDEAVAHAADARELVLKDQGLRSLPAKIAKLEHLEVLDISANPLRSLPDWLFDLKTLRVLRIDGTGLTEIPAEIAKLTALEDVALGGFNKFTELPVSMRDLHKLRAIDLADASALTSLPDWFSSLPQLEELRLVHTKKITNVAETLVKLPRLRSLVLDDVVLASLPDKPLLELRRLALARLQISTLPAWIGSLTHLEDLRIDANAALTEIPEALGNLVTLRSLDVRLVKPLSVPDSLGKLVHLERLALVRCGLTELPSWLFGLTNLTWLYVGLNPISHVPAEISKLDRLQELNLGNNPALAPQRDQIIAWLPKCELKLTPTTASSAPTPAAKLPSVSPAKPAAEVAAPAPKPQPYKSSRDASGASAWPELGRVDQWVCLDDKKQGVVTKALAKSLGPTFKAIEPWGTYRFPRFEDASSGLVFIAIVGDRFEMGLNESEKRELSRRTKTWSDEAKEHAAELSKIARPVHEVHVPAFLCAEMPITAAHARSRMPSQQSAGEVCLFDPSSAVSYAKLVGSRLLTESEWEYVARAGGGAGWLSLKTEPKKYDPQVFVRDALAKGLAGDDGFLFGVRGLGWGSWVEDGWHPSYQGAPTDGSAWAPRQLPEVVRGGAFLSWPWQSDGEALLLHVTHRERKEGGKFPLLVARDLPSNR